MLKYMQIVILVKLNLTIVKINNNYYLQSDENNITIQNVKTTNKKVS